MDFAILEAPCRLKSPMQLPFALFILLMPLMITDSAATDADSDTLDGELVASDADSTATDADSATSDEAAEEKSDFEVVLKEIGTNKIAVIKEVRTITLSY